VYITLSWIFEKKGQKFKDNLNVIIEDIIVIIMVTCINKSIKELGADIK
jgi:hypothetical protein